MGQNEPVQGKHAEHIHRLGRFIFAERRTGNGAEDVERHAGDMVASQGKGHVQTVIFCFPQAHNAAGADFQSCLLDAADMVFLFLIGMGGADIGEIPLRRFQVAVNPLASGFLQLPELVIGQKAQGAAHGQLRLLGNELDCLHNGSKLHRVALAPSAGDDAEPFRAVGFCLLCFMKQVFRAP